MTGLSPLSWSAYDSTRLESCLYLCRYLRNTGGNASTNSSLFFWDEFFLFLIIKGELPDEKIRHFIITSVGLSFAVLLAVLLVKDRAPTISNCVYSVFSKVFMFGVCLSIGPFLGIPRNANVAYEIGVKSFLNEAGNPALTLFIYPFVFFALVYGISLDPSKSDREKRTLLF
ncbi:branched-chain amino acid transport system II carrier protein [Bacillus sp. FJAT-52991]|uniref:Branched-chain amino acid transport system carrier protein n=1 Tax=Bacillus kandeliae TaxID=3129297 RepID=A0ABZ2N4P7_9BACI